MKTFRRYLSAFGRAHTYNPTKNPYLWFGLLWGIPVPIFSVALDLSLIGPPNRTVLDALAEHPIHYVFLLHPYVFALVFGAMGTVRHELEEENRGLIERLTNLATTDALTGLYNRRYVMEELQKALQRSRRDGQGFSVILFDLDRFKAINDLQGHQAGDEILKQTAQAIRGALREADVLGRYGGDEFLLLAYGDMPSALNLISRASEAVRASAGLEVSAGVSRFPQDGETVDLLIARADSRLAEVKRVHHETDRRPSR